MAWWKEGTTSHKADNRDRHGTDAVASKSEENMLVNMHVFAIVVLWDNASRYRCSRSCEEGRSGACSIIPETLAAQALGEVGATPRGLVPPIHPATTYERDPDGAYPSGLAYTRADNPTYEPAEQLLAALEGQGLEQP
jgi:hypothetical protein